MICARGKCQAAKDRNETDTNMSDALRLFELRIIKKLFGLRATRKWMKMNRDRYHAYTNTTRFRAPGMTLKQVQDKLRLWAAPQVSYDKPQRDRPVVSGDESELWVNRDVVLPSDVLDSVGLNVPLPGGMVTHYIDEATGVLANVTQPDHRLYPGYILRWVEQLSDGSFVIHTLGRGLGFHGRVNELSGARMFTEVDDAIVRDLRGSVIE